MAEIALKIGTVGPDPNYQDGDIVDVFTNRRIRCVHAEHICHLNNFGFNTDGLRPESLASFFLETVRQYKFERVGSKTLKRTNLETLQEDTFTDIPNSKSEYIFVEDFINKNTNHVNHIIFGTKGREYWYGGRTDVSNLKLNIVWNKIETETNERESMPMYKKWPLTTLEKSNFLALEIEDIDEQSSNELKYSEYDGDDLLRKRKNMIDWQSINLPISKHKIKNKGFLVDIRDFIKFNVFDIKFYKPDLKDEVFVLPFKQHTKYANSKFVGITNIAM